MPLKMLSFHVAYPAKMVMPRLISLSLSLHHRITSAHEINLMCRSRLVSHHKYASLFETNTGWTEEIELYSFISCQIMI